MRNRLLALSALAVVALFLMASAAFAAPPSVPAVMQSVTFESANATDTLQVYTSYDPFGTHAPAPSTWGIVTQRYLGGTHGFWCGGSTPALWPNYQAGTRGGAVLYVPDASQYFESTIQFSYIEPSIGVIDYPQPFVVNWASPSPTSSAGTYVDAFLPITSTWTTVTRTRGAAGNNPPLTAGWLRFQFESNPVQDLTGEGATVDDISITGYEFGPVNSLSAARQQGALGNVDINWVKPSARGTNTPDPRTIWYRIWRHDLAANTWVELTGSAISARTFIDTSADVAHSYQYAVQAYDSASNTVQWGVLSTSATVDKAIVSPPDTTPPSTTIQATPASNAAGWNPTDVAVGLTAVDDLSGSGVAGTYYTLDGGLQQSYNTAFTLSTEGVHTLSYWSVDASGNVEPANTATIRIDKTLPLLSLDAAGPYTGTATIHAIPSDALSGLGHVDIKLDSATSWTSGATQLSTSVLGSHTVYARAFDLAGNERDVSASFTVLAPPYVALSTTTKLVGPSSVRVKKSLKLTGTISLSAAPGRVTITMTRLVGRRWRSYATAKVTVVRGNFSYSFKPRYRGSWRFVATYSGGVVGWTTYRSSKSGIKSVKVR